MVVGRGALVAVLTGCTLAALPGLARAKDVFPTACDGMFRPQSCFSSSETVCVSGDVDFTCPAGPISLPGADFYVVPAGTPAFDGVPVHHDTLGGFGSFIDVAVMSPPLPCGTYDIVMDEQCDGALTAADVVVPDAFTVVGDGCPAADCSELACGDGVLDRGEVCDDGPDNSDTEPDACRTDCTEARCGDGVVDADESCDEGPDNGDPRSSCTADCMLVAGTSGGITGTTGGATGSTSGGTGSDGGVTGDEGGVTGSTSVGPGDEGGATGGEGGVTGSAGGVTGNEGGSTSADADGDPGSEGRSCRTSEAPGSAGGLWSLLALGWMMRRRRRA